jgi:hypothetical protein
MLSAAKNILLKSKDSWSFNFTSTIYFKVCQRVQLITVTVHDKQLNVCVVGQFVFWLLTEISMMNEGKYNSI